MYKRKPSKSLSYDIEERVVGAHLNLPEEINNFPVFPSRTGSLLSKCLTRNIWEELKDTKDNQGFSFKQAIFSGCKNLDSSIGVYAGSHDSYKTFATLFNQIIEKYHNFHNDEVQLSDIDASKLKFTPLNEEEDAMIISTRIRVARNLEDYPLSPALTREQRIEIMNKVANACKTFKGGLEGEFYPLEKMSKRLQTQLIEDHYLFKEGDRFLEAGNLTRDWPSGRGIFYNKDKTFLIWVNEEDQLRIISIQKGANIKQVFERLCKAIKILSDLLKFDRDDHLGFITSCPTNIGTGLRASVHIRLPKLSQNKQKLQEIADNYELQIRGVDGEHSSTDGDVFDVSNRRRIGKTEVELVEDMCKGVQALIAYERSYN